MTVAGRKRSTRRSVTATDRGENFDDGGGETPGTEENLDLRPGAADGSDDDLDLDGEDEV